MKISNYSLVFVIIGFLIQSLGAQSLSDQLSGIFGEVLEIQLEGSPGEHGQHFFPANVKSSETTINAFTSFISTNISSIPLSSTSAGLTFDFSTGAPVATSTSLGPIFAERAQTIGKWQFNLGFNFSHFNMSRLRGTNMNDLRFTFIHQDVDEPGLGDSENEFDTIDLLLNMDLSASVMAFFLTVGITNRLDIYLAVPLVNVRMKATPLAQVTSFTYLIGDTANHHFGDDPVNPELSTNPESIDDDATGVGDIAVRAKYNFFRGKHFDFGALLEYRFPTGDETDFLGAGESSYRAMLIASSVLGDFSPHLNIAYAHRGGIQKIDYLDLALGYDQKLAGWFTLAVDFLSAFEISSDKENSQFPSESVTISGVQENKLIVREVSLTNVPNFSNDNIIAGSFGFKMSLKKEMIIIGNVIIPFNERGLRSSFVPTFGFEFNF
jgi:hypothetical protein